MSQEKCDKFYCMKIKCSKIRKIAPTLTHPKKNGPVLREIPLIIVKIIKINNLVSIFYHKSENSNINFSQNQI